MRTFGDIVRLLMERRGLTGAALGREIELSKTSVSKILQGHSKPKQITFSRLMKALCRSPEEEQLMLRGFTGEAYELPEMIVEDSESDLREEQERAERYLEMKTHSIAFRHNVAGELTKMGISYEAEFCVGIYSTDFLVERGGQRFALECKYNARRDMQLSLAVAKLLLAKLPCDQVSIVVPFLDPANEPAALPQGIRIEPVSALTNRLALIPSR